MEDNELISIIKKIDKIRSMKKEEQKLRKQILNEFNKRLVSKINFNENDYIKLIEYEVDNFEPCDFHQKLVDKGMEDIRAMWTVIQTCKISKKGIDESMGKNWTKENMKRNSYICKNQINYQINSNGNGKIRSIDL